MGDIKNFFNSFVLIAMLSLGVFSVASAQENKEQSNENDGEIVIIADMDFEEVVMEKQVGDDFYINFDIVNHHNEALSNIVYAAQLVGVGEREFLYEKIYYDDEITLAPNTTLKREIVFTAPSYLKGRYELKLIARSKESMTLENYSVGEIVLNGTGKYIDIDTKACALFAGGDSSQAAYSLEQGVDISSDENLKIECSIKNSFSYNSVYTPKLMIYEDSIFGDNSPEEKDLNKEYIVANEEKSVSFILPKSVEPGTYDSTLSFYNEEGSQISNEVKFHFVIQGESGTIQSVRFNKNSFEKGDIAITNFVVGGSADSFPGSRANENLSEKNKDIFNLEVTINNLDGSSCSDTISKELVSNGGVILSNLEIPIKNKCDKALAIFILKNEKGEILDEEGVMLLPSEDLSESVGENSSREIGSMQNLFVLLLIVSVTALIVILLVVFKKFPKGGMKILLFVMILSSIFMISSNEAEAGTSFSFVRQAIIQYYGYYDLDKSTYCAGDSMVGESGIGVWICHNRDVAISTKWKKFNTDPYSTIASKTCANQAYWDGSRWIHPFDDCTTYSATHTNKTATGGTETATKTAPNAGSYTASFNYDWDWKGTGDDVNTYDENVTKTEGYTVDACSLTTTLSINYGSGCVGGCSNGTQTITLTATSSGSASGTDEYRFLCKGVWSAWSTSNTYSCSYGPGSALNQTVRAKGRRGTRTDFSPSAIATLSACAACPAPPVCGNNILEILGGEQCDDGNTSNGDGCNSTCLNEVSASCGNRSTGQKNGSYSEIETYWDASSIGFSVFKASSYADWCQTGSFNGELYIDGVKYSGNPEDGGDFPQPGQITTWECGGYNGGSPASCSATRDEALCILGENYDCAQIATGNLCDASTCVGGITTSNAYCYDRCDPTTNVDISLCNTDGNTCVDQTAGCPSCPPLGNKNITNWIEVPAN